MRYKNVLNIKRKFARRWIVFILKFVADQQYSHAKRSLQNCNPLEMKWNMVLAIIYNGCTCKQNKI